MPAGNFKHYVKCYRHEGKSQPQKPYSYRATQFPHVNQSAVIGAATSGAALHEVQKK